MITIENLTKKFGTKTAVDKVSFSLEKGEIMGFIGPNGAGKSTTMRMITGFLPPTSGTVMIDEFDMSKFPIEAKALIGYLPENAPLYSNKTVSEFLEFAAELRGFYGKEKKEKVEKVLETCFLENVKNQIIDTLSKGYRQRTCFAQALLHDPEILILDEPTDGLDPNQKMEVRKLIKKMSKDKAIIISTHILEEVEAVTNRVILIANGQKKFDGKPREFSSYSEQANTFDLELLDADSNKVKSVLSQCQEIKSVELISENANKINFRLSPRNKNKLNLFKNDIAELIAKNQWKVSSLQLNKGELNEVFSALTGNNNDNNLEDK